MSHAGASTNGDVVLQSSTVISNGKADVVAPISSSSNGPAAGVGVLDVLQVQKGISSSSTGGDVVHLQKQSSSSIEVRKISFGSGGAGAGGYGAGGRRQTSSASQSRASSSSSMSNLKMQMISMGSGAGVSKVLAVDPQAVVLSREKEKIALQDLNDRFAAYIERVRFLEADNKRLQSIITELTLKFDQLDAALRAIYEDEMRAARTTIDKTTALKAAAELRANNAETKLVELMALYQAEVEAHSITKETLPKLEKMISERDAQIDFLTKNMTALEKEVQRIKLQGMTLQQELMLAKQAADGEIIARVELESLAQTREDELVFMKAMYEEKIKSLLALDLGSDAFKAAFSNELALALRDIRNEYETIMEATRTQDTDAWYRAKFTEVMSVTQRQTGELTLAKQEVSNWRNKYQALSGDYSAMQAMISGLEGRINALTADLAAAEASYETMVNDKDDIIKGLNARMMELFSSIQNLTDLKLALDAEIATYRRLLQAEDSRLSTMSTMTTTTTTTTTIINPFIQVYEEEDSYYKLAFAYCDADHSGHVTTTELKNAFEWMNKHNFGGRSERKVSYPYVNEILKKGDVDSSLTLDYPEFVRLMKMEKSLFVNNALSKYSAGTAAYDNVVDIFKQAGYVWTEAWTPFLKQYQKSDGQIAYKDLLPLLM
jgi:intermediate filament protein if